MWEFCNILLENLLSFIYFSIKGSALSPFFPLGLWVLPRPVRSLQRIFVFAAVGVSQSIQEVGVYQSWPDDDDDDDDVFN